MKKVHSTGGIPGGQGKFIANEIDRSPDYYASLNSAPQRKNGSLKKLSDPTGIFSLDKNKADRVSIYDHIT